MLNIALPKGRLGKQVYELFDQIGYSCNGFMGKTRELIIENKDKNFRYFLVKPSDVAIYVEHGAADIGVVGQDILEETQPDVYEILDMRLGRCNISVAAPNEYKEKNSNETLRVATKYLNIAKDYYSSKNQDIEIIKLNGSIELAPILNLADVIVDIVETGDTLRANNMKVVTAIKDISARLIVNKASYKFKDEQINEIRDLLKGVIKND